MRILPLASLLRFTRPLAYLLLLASGFEVILLLARTVAAFDSAPVELTLYTTDPNIFPTLHAIHAGLVGDSRPSRTVQLYEPAVKSPFEIASNPQALVLRYHEPSAERRVALLYLGASNEYQSLAWGAFLAVGSWLLWQLLLDVTPATPFTFTNARRLRGLGLLVLGLDFAQELAYLAVRALVPPFRVPGLTEPLSHYVRLNTETTLPGWEVGLMLLVIAAVYQRGVELSREAELVI
ncbi:hypothetical protein GCM10022409_30270 [Hymenobacter glaciei]|uniref:DUF2975 domain-containing protein n=1 Tax=Hymenobacter glaciei TaxID=877209 RepID=A0ABP7UFG3_9BACT